MWQIKHVIITIIKRRYMKDKNILIAIGILGYVILSVIDKFIYKLPDIIYIVVALILFVLILVGGIKIKKILTNKS